MKIFTRKRAQAPTPGEVLTTTQEEVLAQARQSLGLPPAKRKRRVRPGVLLANLVTIGVGAAAGFVSWQHLSKLGEDVGATEESAFLTPFTIDGMILAGTLELRQARIEERPARVWSYVAVLIGVVGTIAGNVRAAEAGNLTAQLYFAAPALAFLISVEVLFGKPLSRNLWELIRDWWAARPRKAPKAEQAGKPVDNPKPDKPDETAKPIKAPEPQKPVKAPESPVDGLTPRLVPEVPAKPRTPARRATGKAAAPKTADRPTGTRQNPARKVGDWVLEGEDLRADARARVSQARQDGKPREGMGVWVARQYDPPMSDNWGLDRVREVWDAPAPVTAEPDGKWGHEVPARESGQRMPDAPVIGPLPVAEEAEPLPV